MDNKTLWEKYVTEELARAKPILTSLGYTLDEHQPHLKGERYLMRALTTASGKKLTLLGSAQNGTRVVIKATSDPAGRAELVAERQARAALSEIQFAYHRFYSPEELTFTEVNGVTISVQTFVEHERPFLERPLAEQFALALKGFKVQEGAHATTYKHLRAVRTIFKTKNVGAYLSAAQTFVANSARTLPDKKRDTLLSDAYDYLVTHKTVVAQYCGFLTHVDFVPHNIRVVGGEIYLLDHSSLTFGNKYEGWARFINFMTLYNQPLAVALTDYVRLNRTTEEVEALNAMRVYRLLEIIWYYVANVGRSDGDLQTLNRARVDFWIEVLRATLKHEWISDAVRSAYQEVRDSLRSADEKDRQRGLH